ncbi:plasmid replication DNA-binding protein [Psychrobacter aestuarii]|uniref:DNA-binding protein n=1 Tax=Psychrobacter aestuarii TaxID=556327 RepID=A0ABP3FVT5_9GAMM|nr:plasmid replication DNA-binding protein [Psychrobacter aestuarii]
MKISVTKAAKQWGVSRTTIYQKINEGELSRTADKQIDTSEMIRVFGEPAAKKRTEQTMNTNNGTSSNSQNVQDCTVLEHQLALEKLKNKHLEQQVHAQKQLIENYQDQIKQLNITLEKANASIHDLTQIRLLEFKGSEHEKGHQQPQTDLSPEIKAAATAPKKKRWFGF